MLFNYPMKNSKQILIFCLIIVFLYVFTSYAQKGKDVFHKSQQDDENVLLYEKTQKANAQRRLSPLVKKEKQVDYYKQSGMYAFDMVPDHWYDPANKKDLREQSIFLVVGIVILSLILKIWKIR